MIPSPTRRRVLVAALVGVVGVLALVALAERPAPWGRALALGAALAAACGSGVAIGLLLAPAASALRVRHLAAGASAAWLAYQLAGGARRAGLADTSDGFKLLWAPLCEEACKALLLAAVWSRADDRRDRRELVSAALGLGVGFAIRENLVYFGVALAQSSVYLLWAAFRAVAPVVAHAAFGMILGGVIAQRTIRARACGAAPRRVAPAGVALAMFAHVVYNGMTLVLARWGAAHGRALELLGAWSAVALLGAFALRARVLRAASTDEPAVSSIVPHDDRTGWRVAGVAGAVALLGVVPWSAARYQCAVFAPLALGVLVTYVVARALRAPRPLSAVVLGVALRPLLRAPELALALAARATHARVLRLGYAWAAQLVWLGALALVVNATARARGRRGAVALACGVACGLAGESIGSALAVARDPRLARLALVEVTHALPVTVLLGTLLGRFAHRTRARALGAAGGVAALAALLGELARRARPGVASGAATVAACVFVVSAVVYSVLRGERGSAVERPPLAPALNALGPRRDAEAP